MAPAIFPAHLVSENSSISFAMPRSLPSAMRFARAIGTPSGNYRQHELRTHRDLPPLQRSKRYHLHSLREGWGGASSAPMPALRRAVVYGRDARGR